MRPCRHSPCLHGFCFHMYNAAGYSTIKILEKYAMTVTVTTQEYGIGKIIGTIDFEGIRVRQPDGGTRIPVMAGGGFAPQTFACHPIAGIPADNFDTLAPKIADQLSAGFVKGSIDGYEWHL
jgi:hypothetical protein